MSEALLNAMEQGLTVLITNTSMVQLDKDTMLLDILQCRRLLHRSKNVVKLLVSLDVFIMYAYSSMKSIVCYRYHYLAVKGPISHKKCKMRTLTN